MKKYLLFIFALTLASVTFAQRVTLKGSVKSEKEIEDGAFYLLKLEDNRMVMHDTLYLNKKGQFEYKTQINEPSIYLLQPNLSHSSGIHLILLPGEKVELEMDWLPPYEMMQLSHAKGSKNMELFSQFHSIIIPQQIELDRILSNIDANESDGHPAFQEYLKLREKQKSDIRNLIDSHSDCLMSALLITYFDQEKPFTPYVSLYEKVRDNLKPNYAENTLVIALDKKLASTLTTGSKAPEIDMLDPDGNHKKLSDLRGKIVMIDFWASWCRPCRMENPHVVSLYKKYHDSGFEIYSVSLDKEKSQWLEAIRRDGLVWENHVSDLNGWTSSGGASYGINSVPSTVLVDKNGRIIARNLRGEELDRKMKEIFGF